MRTFVSFSMCVCDFMVKILLVKNLIRRDAYFRFVHYVCSLLHGKDLVGKDLVGKELMRRGAHVSFTTCICEIA